MATGPLRAQQSINSTSSSSFLTGWASNVAGSGKSGVAPTPETYNGIAISSVELTWSGGT
jgi:hypothetical protein